jgi:two-component system alkaline phosphatase synthesis response regulator PhoP
MQERILHQNKEMPPVRTKILVIDADQGMHDFIRLSLRELNAELHFFLSPKQGLEYAKAEIPGLIILDLANAEMDGIEFCTEIRRSAGLKEVLIALFTSRSEDYSQIAGFNAGADEYILKPVRPLLFLSRIKALLRRFRMRPATAGSFKGIVIDRERYIVRKDNKEILLPRKEFELISLLLTFPKKVFSRKEIYTEIWGGEMDRNNRTIDVHIRKLREKIGETHIKTIKGIGYRFER